MIHAFIYGSQGGSTLSGIEYIPFTTSGIGLMGGGPISNEDFATTYCCEWTKAYSVAKGGVVYLVWTQQGPSDPDAEIYLTSIKGSTLPGGGGGGDDNCMISRTGPASNMRIVSFLVIWLLPFLFIAIQRIGRKRV